MRRTLRLQFYPLLGVVAHLLAWYVLRHLGVPYWASLVALATLFIAGFEILIGRPGKSKVNPYDGLNQLPVSEVEVRAREILNDPARFSVDLQEDKPDSTVLANLGGITAGFFSEFSSVRSVAGELQLSHELIGPSGLKPGFVRIGTDVEHTEVAVIAGEDWVYELDELSRDEIPTPTYRTVFHLILAIDEQLHD